MEIVILLVFVSLVFVVGALAFFAWNLEEGTHQHADRLALLPLEDDRPDSGPATGPRDRRTGPLDGTDPASRSADSGRSDDPLEPRVERRAR